MYQITYDHYILYDPRFATAEDKLMITEPDVYLAVVAPLAGGVD